MNCIGGFLIEYQVQSIELGNGLRIVQEISKQTDFAKKVKCQESSKTLAREYIESQQDKETTLLKKHRVINDSGVVTMRGIELICQVILENKDIKNKIVEYLEGKDN